MSAANVKSKLDNRKASCAVWDQDKDALLVGLLQEQANIGKRTDSAFKKEAWTAVTQAFQEKTLVNYDREQLKARYKQVRTAK